MAKSIYKELIAMKYGGARTYIDLENVCVAAGDDAGAKLAVKEGRVAYPNDKNLILEEMYSSIKEGKTKEAIDNVNLAIQKDPQKEDLQFILGTLYYNLANPTAKDAKAPTDVEKKDYLTKSEAAYKKALEIKPDYFDGLLNLGILYYNEGVGINNAADAIKDNNKYKLEIARAEAKFKEALPLFEKAKVIGSKDKNDQKNLLNNLKQLYLLIGDQEKFKQTQEELKGL